MNERIKIIGISIGIGVITTLSFVFGRSFNRSGIRSDNDSSDGIREGNQVIEDGLGKLNSGLEDGIEKSGGITKRAGTVEDKLQSAIGILRAAKEKNKANMVG